jgi:hypothetical protein
MGVHIRIDLSRIPVSMEDSPTVDLTCLLVLGPVPTVTLVDSG